MMGGAPLKNNNNAGVVRISSITGFLHGVIPKNGWTKPVQLA
ncbi:hypothetical protein CEV34_1030 [Brucella pseudogrignonensis]|jgi:hypothetical protein|uniref:Uncharacterized protein n=1 Tax=Brucella pseudogrignonensis TaxID=419475 RepID=A0A256GPU8_9HYPH|nr:hypothetical protein CEV34_1030 [Brucella pseudogrignonensis]